jgi:hypothetical protein
MKDPIHPLKKREHKEGFIMAKIHPRHFTVTEAEIKLGTFVNNLIEEYDLTFAEVVKITMKVGQDWINYAVQEERKPAPMQAPSG